MDSLDAFHALIGRSGEDISFAQMLARAVVVLVVGFALVRFSTPRIFSKATPIDIVLAVVIGSNLSRTLTGNAPFLPVIAATVALVVLHAVITHLAVRWRPLGTFIKGEACVLARDGDLDWHQLHRCAVGERDLLAAVRSAGGTEISQIKLATVERGGDIEVVLRAPS